MHSSESGAPGDRPVASTHVVEAVVAASIIAFGGLVLVGSRNLGSGWTSDGPGAGFFPFYIGIILVIAGAGVLFQALAPKTRNTDGFVTRDELKRVLQVLIPAAVYVLAIQFLGMYVASAIYITIFMVWLGKYSWLKSVVVGVAINVVFFLMFEVWFKVPLFKGSLAPLSFLRY